MATSTIANFKAIFDATTQPMVSGLQAGSQSLGHMAEKAEDLTRELRQVPNNVDVDVDVEGLVEGELKLKEWLRRQRAELLNDMDVNVDIDMARAQIKLKRLDRDLDRLDRKDVHPEVHIDAHGLAAASIAMRGIAQSTAAIGANGPLVAGAAVALAAAGAAIAGPLVVGTVQVGAFAAATYGLLDAYDQLERGNQKFAVVFGGQAEAVDEWARTISTSVGVGVEDLKGMASGIQDILVPIGFDRAQAADLTMQLYERGVALAQFSGTDTATAIDAITKGLTGERETLKQFGIVLNEAQVQTRMNTLKNTAAAKGLSDQELKSLATMELIEEMSTDAWQAYQDGLNTAGKSLNALKVLWANFKDDVILGLGQIAVGIIEDLDFGDMTKGLAGVSDWIAENAEEIRSGMIGIAKGGVAGASALLVLGDVLLRTIPPMMHAAAAGGYLNSALQSFSASATSLVDKDAGEVMKEMARTTWLQAEALSGSATAMEELTKDGGAGLQALRDRLAEIGLTLDDLSAKDEVRVEVMAAVDQGDWKTVKSKMDELGKKQVARILANLPEKERSASERKLARLARKRKAEIKAEAETTKAEAELDRVARKDYRATIKVAIESGYTPGSVINPEDFTKSGPVQQSAPGNTTVILDGYRVATAIAERTSIQHREVWV